MSILHVSMSCECFGISWKPVHRVNGRRKWLGMEQPTLNDTTSSVKVTFYHYNKNSQVLFIKISVGAHIFNLIYTLENVVWGFHITSDLQSEFTVKLSNLVRLCLNKNFLERLGIWPGRSKSITSSKSGFTTEREHIKSQWRGGRYLVECLPCLKHTPDTHRQD